MPVVYINARQELVFINQHFKNFFGYTLQDIPDISTWAVFAYPDEAYRKWALETWDESLRLAVDNGGVIRPVDYQVRCKNGSIRNVEISGINLNEGLLTTFIDVTAVSYTHLDVYKRQSQEHSSMSKPRALSLACIEVMECSREASLPGIKCSVCIGLPAKK